MGQLSSHESTQQTIKDLSNFSVKPRQPISGQASYPFYLARAKRVYDQLHYTLPNLEYRPYQYEVAALYAVRRKNLCAGAQGVGKTFIAGLLIPTIYYDIATKRPGTVHVVAPSLLSANSRWIEDLNKIPDLHNLVEVITTERQILNSTKPVWIYTMDFLKRKSKSLHNSRSSFARLMIKTRRNPSLLILDEVHHYRWNTERTQHIRLLRRKAKRILGLSGTITDGRLDLVHEACQLIYGSNWNYSAKEFNRTFGVKQALRTNYLSGEEEQVEAQPRYLAHLAFHKVSEYFSVFERYVHRLRLDDPNVQSCVRLPKVESIVKVVPMQSEHEQAYRAIVQQSLTPLAALAEHGGVGSQGRALSYLRPLMETCSCPNLGQGVASVAAKAVECGDLIEEAVQTEEKTVVFCHMVPAARYLYHYLSERFGSSSVVRLYASDDQCQPRVLSDAARSAVIDELQFGAACAGVFSIALSSESIDLTQVSRVIFYDLPWQAIRIAQAVKRCERPGASRDLIKVHYLAHQGSIDMHMLYLLTQLQRQARVLLDFDADAISESEVGSLNPIEVIRALLETYHA